MIDTVSQNGGKFLSSTLLCRNIIHGLTYGTSSIGLRAPESEAYSHVTTALLTTPTIDDSPSRPHPPPPDLLPAGPASYVHISRQNWNDPHETDPTFTMYVPF